MILHTTQRRTTTRSSWLHWRIQFYEEHWNAPCHPRQHPCASPYKVMSCSNFCVCVCQTPTHPVARTTTRGKDTKHRRYAVPWWITSQWKRPSVNHQPSNEWNEWDHKVVAGAAEQQAVKSKSVFQTPRGLLGFSRWVVASCKAEVWILFGFFFGHTHIFQLSSIDILFSAVFMVGLFFILFGVRRTNKVSKYNLDFL